MEHIFNNFIGVKIIQCSKVWSLWTCFSVKLSGFVTTNFTKIIIFNLSKQYNYL
jgi:hypothetical protein